MRVSRVEIERFLGFKSLAMDLDPELQLVAGPNNAGKSSLVRLLEAFFSNPTGDDLSKLKPLNDYYASLGTRTLSSIQVWFSDLSMTEKTTFAPILRNDGRMWISVRCSRGNNLSYTASRNVTTDVSQAMYREVVSTFRFVKIPSVRVGNTGGQDEPESLERLLETLEAILIRSGASRSTTLQQDFAAKISPVEALVKSVLDESAEAISAELPFREQTVRIELPDSKHALRGMLESAVIRSIDDIDVPISERGTGFQSALVLGILRYVATREGNHHSGNLMFAIEEPEAFLHPQTQRAMAKIISDISGDAQILATTHSPVLVDSFRIDRIARLPLQSDGTEYTWQTPKLAVTDAGRLSRYCNASNSELVFANAVVIVEGEGDFAVVEHLLSRLCGAPGGHYGLGITVIDAGGIDTMKYIVQLAELFRVRSYALVDKDGVKKRNGKRKLLDMLTMRPTAPDNVALDAIRTEGDKVVSTSSAALTSQKALNSLLKPHDAFVLSSDLEGVLLDTYGASDLATALGPAHHAAIGQPEVVAFSSPTDGYEKLAAWLGSKGWNSDGSTTQKIPPHLPAILIREWLDTHSAPSAALADLLIWLGEIVSDNERARL